MTASNSTPNSGWQSFPISSSSSPASIGFARNMTAAEAEEMFERMANDRRFVMIDMREIEKRAETEASALDWLAGVMDRHYGREG